MELRDINLESGSHKTREDGLCAMEAAAMLSGDIHTESPVCVCRAIRDFLIRWNDYLPDDESRNRLIRPYLSKILGTRGNKELKQRRRLIAADWVIRVHLPMWLDMNTELQVYSRKLREFPRIDSKSVIRKAETLINETERAAKNQERYDLCYYTEVEREVGSSAGYPAAYASMDMACYTACMAAHHTGENNVTSLKKTVDKLQESACLLLETMINE